MKDKLLKLFDLVLNAYCIFYLGLFLTDYSFIAKKGLSNISGFTAVFFFLLLIRWRLDRASFFDILTVKTARAIFNRLKMKMKKFLWLCFILLVFLLTLLGVIRHYSLSTMAWDMGIFEQALWNTLHGDILFSSIRGNINLLGDHFEPILFLLMPFYALKPHVVTLIILQQIIIASAIFPLYLVARNKLNSRFLIFSFIISFLLSKGVRGVALSDFHPEAFILPLTFMSYYYIEKKQNLFLALSCCLMILTKETAVFSLAGLGIYALFFLRRRVAGLTLIFVAATAWLLETKIIIPFFNDYNKSFFYYGRLPFGDTLAGNLRFIINNPGEFLGFIFMPAKLEYIFNLSGPLVFLPFLSFAHYALIFMPMIIVFLASAKLAGYFSVNAHYVAWVLPFVYIGAIAGASNLILWLKMKSKISEESASRIVGASLILFSLLFYGKTDAHKLSRYLEGVDSNRAKEKISLLSLVPSGVSVSATSNFVPHLSHRKYIYDWDPLLKLSYLTEYVVIDLDFQGYLKQGSKNKIPDFFAYTRDKGYEIIFSNPQKRFFIMRNPASGIKAIEDFRGNIGF